MKHKKLTVLEDNAQLIVVYDGPRGAPGQTGAPGSDGRDGHSITPRGDWVDNIEYQSGDAVAHRSLKNPGLTSLWVLKQGYTSTVGKAPWEEPDRYMEIGGSGSGPGSSAANVLQVYQAGHPFVHVGEPVAFSQRTGRWELADVRDEDLFAIGVVAEITDKDHFAVQFNGQVEHVEPKLLFDPANPAGRGLLDWEPGRLYYLSTVPGMYQREQTNANGAGTQPMVVPTSLDKNKRTVTLNILTWGPDGISPDAHAGAAPPQMPVIGDLWYRTDKFQGLYVWLDLADGGPVWVQTNG